MNTPEIERLVTAALTRDAEDAMNRTHTPERLVAFRQAAEHDALRRRRMTTIGTLVAAAAVAVVVVALSWPRGDDGTAPPVGPATRTERISEAEQVATSFVDALATFDRARAATYVDSGSRVTLGGAMDDVTADPWRLRSRWDEATGWRVTQRGRCHQTSVGATDVHVVCGYAAHQLGSDRLGRGPFGSNELLLTIRDGAVVAASLTTAHETNGFADTMWNPFWSWMDRRHPGDRTSMAAFEQPGASAAEIADSLALWQLRVRQYVAAVRAGTAR